MWNRGLGTAGAVGQLYTTLGSCDDNFLHDFLDVTKRSNGDHGQVKLALEIHVRVELGRRDTGVGHDGPNERHKGFTGLHCVIQLGQRDVGILFHGGYTFQKSNAIEWWLR